MNYVLGFLALLLLSVLVSVVCQNVSYQRGFEAGRSEGYAVGRVDADNWWLDAEQSVDQARQNIWREEGMKS
jgi:hypothetical protein